MDFTSFIIMSVAVWWISRILTFEAGPYKLVEKFRNSIINEKWSPIQCLRCTSVWVAFFISLFLNLPFLTFFLVWFGASGVAVLIEAFRDMYLEREVIIQEIKEDGM